MENCKESRQVTNRGEYGKGETGLAEAILNRFSSGVFDAAACQELLIEVLHAGGADCPNCGLAVESDAQLRAWVEFRRLQCRHCATWFTATTGTVLAGSALEERQVVLLAVLASLGVPTSLTAALVGCSTDTVRRWRDRL